MADTPIPSVIRVNPMASRLLNKNFGAEEFRYNRWFCDLTEEQTLADAQRPEFFAEQSAIVIGHDATSPRGIGDLIAVRKPDTGGYWELIIREIGKGYIKTQIKAECAAEAVTVPDGGLTTRWNVGRRSHEVVRKDTGAVLSGGHQTKPAAIKWIEDHMKAMAA